MTVLDASVMVRALTNPDLIPPRVRPVLVGRLQVPAIFPAEVTSGFRGMVIRREITLGTAMEARRRLGLTRLRLHPFGLYADRIWELRDNLTVYDAWYVAIAERLDQPLLTGDLGILRAAGLRCELIDAR